MSGWSEADLSSPEYNAQGAPGSQAEVFDDSQSLCAHKAHKRGSSLALDSAQTHMRALGALRALRALGALRALRALLEH